jgi:hypothetical protein
MIQTPPNPIQTTRNADDTRTVTYFWHEVGHYSPIRYLKSRERGWRYVSVHGHLGYASSERAAQRALMEHYH